MVKRRIRRILVPLDGSKPSLDGLCKAIEIAKPIRAKITGLCVIETGFVVSITGLQTQLRSYLTDVSVKVIIEAKKLASVNGVEFNGKLLYGSASLEIFRFANDKKYDLVVLGTRKNGTKEFVLGSVVNAVIHKSQAPVLLIK